MGIVQRPFISIVRNRSMLSVLLGAESALVVSVLAVTFGAYVLSLSFSGIALIGFLLALMQIRLVTSERSVRTLRCGLKESVTMLLPVCQRTNVYPFDISSPLSRIYPESCTCTHYCIRTGDCVTEISRVRGNMVLLMRLSLVLGALAMLLNMLLSLFLLVTA